MTMHVTSAHEPGRFVPGWEAMAWRLMAVLVMLGVVLRLLFAVITGNAARLSATGWWHAVLGGLRFDAAVAATLALVMLLGMWLLYRIRVLAGPWRGWLLPPVACLYLMQVGDLLYARESGRHVSYEIVELVGSSDDLWRMLPEFWPFLLPLPLLLFILFRFRLPGRWQQDSRRRVRGLVTEARLLLLVAISVLVIRGSVHAIPLSPGDANALGNVPVAEVALNGGYAVAYSALHADLSIRKPVIKALPADEERQRLEALYAGRDATVLPQGAVARPMNVIMVFLESWPAELIKSYGNTDDVAPEFDRIRARSLTTDRMLAGGHRTVEGLFSTLCSFQNPEGESVPGSQLLAFDYQCLPRFLRDRGWDTAFFQGGHRNSAKVGVLVERLGVQHIYGKEDMPARLRYPPNSWGPHDFDLFDFVLDKKRAMAEPYFIGINTTTTHDETLPPGVTPAFGMDSFRARTESVLHFADSAVGEFVRKLDAGKTKYPTLLVLVSDHTAHVNSSVLNGYSIAFALYAPGIVQPVRQPVVAAQRDISPTVLDAMGMAPPLSWAGKSLLHMQGAHFAEYQHAGHVGWIQGDRLVDFRADSGSDLHCYRWRQDALMQAAVPCDAEDAGLQHNALAFTHYSMELLFSGQTRRFYSSLQPAGQVMVSH